MNETKFWRNINRQNTNGCMNWLKNKDPDGYGKLRWKGKQTLAHRLVWTLVHGQIPADLCCLHICDNPGCCNVKHLFLGTQADNIKDMVSKNRHYKGEAHHKAKLTENDVLDIRRLGEKGLLHREIARKFNITRPVVSYILRGYNWKHVGGKLQSPRCSFLTKEEVIQIYKLAKKGVSQANIARQFNRSSGTISLLLSGKRRKNLYKECYLKKEIYMLKSVYGIEYFVPLINRIPRQDIRILTKQFLSEAPAYFWSVSATLSGSYHPIHSRGPGGTCRHTYETVLIGEGLASTEGIRQKDSPLELSMIMSALLCHDVTKYGEADDYTTIDSRKAYAIHGNLCYARMIKFAEKNISQKDVQKQWFMIGEMVQTHMGAFGPIAPKTTLQKIVSYADMCASMNFLIHPALLKEAKIAKEKFGE